jgi:hypothetical protein
VRATGIGIILSLEPKIPTFFSTSMKLFAAAIEYAPQVRIDGEQLTYVRLKVICEADGLTLWEGDFEDIEAELAENDIHVKTIRRLGDNYVARIDVSRTNIADFVEWAPNVKTDSLCLRTFYTILNKDGKDMFGIDSAWNTVFLGDRSLADWYRELEAKV